MPVPGGEGHRQSMYTRRDEAVGSAFIRILDVTGLRALLRKTVLPRLYAPRAMRFPPFDTALHKTIIMHSDYHRYATIGNALQRITSEHVPGGLAEVGVYRGEMSWFIHRMLPDRPLYLFDTFEGFPRADLPEHAGTDDRFRNTSVELVLRRIGDTRNVVVRKGSVPETFANLEGERFAFVLLDLDLLAPTLRSLEFFYPRLSSGGYLMVHDYNSPESAGACKQALDSFMAGRPEHIIDIADVAGTAMFRRS